MESFEGALGLAIGRLASARTGLNAVYLPEGLSDSFTASIAQEANRLRPSKTPFAIVVTDEPATDDRAPHVGRTAALRYRQGDRLAVVPSTTVDIASFDGSFRPVMEASFPTTAGDGFGVEALAATASAWLSELMGAEVLTAYGAQVLEVCMRQTAAIITEEREGAASWNALWFVLVDRALTSLARMAKTLTGDGVSGDVLITKYGWAAFGLPKPDVDLRWKRAPKEFVEAVASRWSSEDNLDQVIAEDRVSKDDSSTPLQQVKAAGLSGLNAAMARSQSSLLGLQDYVRSSVQVTEAFAALNSGDFFGQPSNDGSAVLTTKSGAPLDIAPDVKMPTYVVTSTTTNDNRISEPFVVRLPLKGRADDADIAGTEIRISPTKNYRLEPLEGICVKHGHLEVAARLVASGKNSHKLDKVSLNIKVGRDDPLFGYVSSQSVTVFVAPSNEPVLLFANYVGKTRLGTPRVAVALRDPDSESVAASDLKSETEYRIIVIAGNRPETTGLVLQETDRARVFTGRLPANTDARASVNGSLWELEAVGAKSVQSHSILGAAVRKVTVAPSDPPADVMSSLLGRLEGHFARWTSEGHFRTDLGHVVLPSDRASSIEELTACHPVQVPNELLPVWRVAAERVGAPSERWFEAREAFLHSWKSCIALLIPVPNDDVASAEWPSKRSTAQLSAQPELLERLLDTYSKLVEAASVEDRLTRFASTFPFSVSVWDLESQARLEAVLLSPWHPLRLAWLTNAESVLRASRRAERLAGTIEGWRFPSLARSNSKNGRLISIPLEVGRDDLFAGWSIMVPMSLDEPQPLRTPRRAAGFPMPGTSASGLTASAADAAIRDFCRVNPHLPSITIDLASSTPSVRLKEIDQCVLDSVKRWGTRPTRGAAIRGVTVMDSLNREGDLPREDALAMLGEAPGTALTWRRYVPDASHPVRSNLRLVEDSGVRIAFDSDDDGPTNGVIGSAALRRFEVPAFGPPGTTRLSPATGPVGSAFVRALHSVESIDAEGLTANVSIRHSQLSDDRADWSISGDSFVPPAVLARSLSELPSEIGNRMLWEWRPPFLDGKGSGSLSRRPYASVMRVSSHLLRSIEGDLALVGNQHAATAQEVIHTLGAQGIGLSSLLTRGGTHSTGALGFFLALRLMEAATVPEKVVQIVMPIDACRQFIDALSDSGHRPETARQADLLVLRIDGGSICLTPIEVKMYGLKGAGWPHLARTDSDFAEPLDQLRSTVVQLDDLIAERQRLQDDDEREECTLWDNAFAALVEAGLRLSDACWHDTVRTTTALRAIVEGDYNLTLGRPLILHFAHGPELPESFAPQKASSPALGSQPEFGALCARPSHVMESLAQDASASPVAGAWADLLNWSCSTAGTPVPQSRPNEEVADSEADHSDEEVIDVVPRRAISMPVAGPRSIPAPSTHAAQIPSPQPHIPVDKADPVDYGPALKEQGKKSTSSEPVPAHESEIVNGPEEATDEEQQCGIRVPLGHEAESLTRRPVEYWPSNTAITQLNVGIVGDLGTGKTQLVRSLLAQVRHRSQKTQSKPVNGLVFDYKADYVSPDFVAATGATVWKPENMPVNPLALVGPYSGPAAYKRASAFAATLSRIYGGLGPVQTMNLKKVIIGLFDPATGTAPTLAEVLAAYEHAYPSSDAVSSILTTFVMGEVFTDRRDHLVTLGEAMEDTLLVIDLNDLGADFHLKNSIVIMFLDMFYEHMKTLKKVPPRLSEGVTLRNISSYLLVDEASNIMEYDFDVLGSLLKEGREFGVGVVLASQFLNHFKTSKTDYAEALSTWFVHKVPNVTAKQLSSLGISSPSETMVERLKTLPVHQSLFKSDMTSARFIMEVPFWQLISDPHLARYHRSPDS